MPEASALSLSNVAAGYGDVRVLWDVSLEIPTGSVHVLLGRNGAGKTTTLRTIAGLNRCRSGTILYCGRDVSRLEPHLRVREGVALVESKRIFRRRTVEENLVLGGYVRGLTPGSAARRHAFDQIYDLFPALRDRRRTSAGALSGGQQQMVAIGQALVRRPQLLMLDEPTAGLAPAVANEVIATVGRLPETGVTILVVEQALDIVSGIASNVTVIDNGRSTLAVAANEPDIRQKVEAAYFE